MAPFDNDDLARQYYVLAFRLQYTSGVLNQQPAGIRRSKVSIADYFAEHGDLRDAPMKVTPDTKAILEYLLETRPTSLDSITRQALSPEIILRRQKYKKS